VTEPDAPEIRHEDMMNEQTISLLKNSFKKVQANADSVAETFYSRLFTIDPDLKPLFKGDIREQGRKLMAALAVAVNNLSNPGAIVPALQEMGKRHRAYGVKDSDYDTVAAALLWTLEQGLGADFTPDCKAAWTDAYMLVATVMKG
jgi:hemoglobin-like flavoprotein